MFALIAHLFDGSEIVATNDVFPSRSSARRARRHLALRRDWAEIRCTRIAD